MNLSNNVARCHGSPGHAAYCKDCERLKQISRDSQKPDGYQFVYNAPPTFHLNCPTKIVWKNEA